MKTRLRPHLLFLAALLLPLLAACRSEPVITPLVQPIVQAVQPLEPVECFFPPPEDMSITCGTIQVPADYTSAITENVDLHVFILESSSPASDPVIFLMNNLLGGFGDNLSQTLLQMLEDRDVILFTREDPQALLEGNDDEEPACPEVEELFIESLEKLLPQEEQDAQMLEAYQACRDRLSLAGEVLPPSNPADTANDLLAVRSALGLQQFNLVASGFSTLAALQLMQTDPGALRSVVLAQFSPPRAAADLQNSFAFSLQRLFAVCAADGACDAAYPNLEMKLGEALNSLNSAPLTLEVRDPSTPAYIQYVVDAPAFTFILRDMLSSNNSLGEIPMVIEDLYTGQGYKLGSELQGQLFFSAFNRQGLNLVDTCAHRWTSQAVEISRTSTGNTELHPLVQQALQADYEQFARICSLWYQSEFNPPAIGAASSSVPLLVLHGGLDPYYAPELVEAYLRGFNQSQLVIFPALSRNVFLGGDCSSGIVASFLEDPSTGVDASCTESQVIEFEYPLN